MKLFLILTTSLLLLTACGSNSSNKSCTEPENPYSDGGHSAGFDWAEQNGANCNGNSDSFNEGCEEYGRQEEAYNECIGNKL